MENIKKFMIDFKNNYSIEDKLITILAISLFLPYVVTGVIIVLISIYVYIKKDFIKMVKSKKTNMFLLVFSIYLLIISIVNQNWLGALISIGVFFILTNILFYQNYIHKKLFETIIDIMIFMSIICCIFAMFEQFSYLEKMENIFSYFDVSNKPQNRVHTFFFNANYYSTMILFVELFCIYKRMTVKENKFYYYIAAALNLFALFLTGSRVALICLIITLLLMFLITKKYRELFISFLSAVIVAIGTLLKIPFIPRLLEYGIALGRRKVVFKTAFLMMKDTWLFGQGPLTYLYRHKDYLDDYIAEYGDNSLGKLGIKSEHTHSLFIEPLVSLGIIGTSIFMGYLISQLLEIYKLFKSKLDQPLSFLILGCLSITIGSNIIDLSIMWIQTGLLLFLILESTAIYTNSLNKKL